jgi:hypothetical protein
LQDSLLGLTTFTVGSIDTVGLDIAGMTINNSPAGNAYLVFYDETNNRNYRLEISSLPGGQFTCECDTIIQASHGFLQGDLLGQTPGNGPYFKANTADPDSLPVVYVTEVIGTDTAVIKSEGWEMTWTHGQLVGRDYFLQDNGTLDTIPDSTYQVFAYRTVRSNKAYFDIPELVIDEAAGAGGATISTVTASNGLNDADAGTDVDVELGGTLDKNTTVENDSYQFFLGNTSGGSGPNYIYNNLLTNRAGFYLLETATVAESEIALGPEFVQIESTDGINTSTFIELQDTLMRIEAYEDVSTLKSSIELDTASIKIEHYDGSNNRESTIELDDETITITTWTASGTTIGTQIQLTDTNVVITNVPNYANDAAADADSNLPSGGVYTVTALGS